MCTLAFVLHLRCHPSIPMCGIPGYVVKRTTSYVARQMWPAGARQQHQTPVSRVTPAWGRTERFYVYSVLFLILKNGGNTNTTTTMRRTREFLRRQRDGTLLLKLCRNPQLKLDETWTVQWNLFGLLGVLHEVEYVWNLRQVTTMYPSELRARFNRGSISTPRMLLR